MKHWLPPITAENKKPHGCLTCEMHGAIPIALPMEARIAVGFGYAALECDGKPIWSEGPNDEWESCLTVKQAERRAAKYPDKDWRIVMHAPLAGRTYQRQGRRNWVLVEQNKGFA